MKRLEYRWATPLAAAGALLLVAAMPAAAAPAQSYGSLKPLSIEHAGDLQQVHYRRWNRSHCRWVKRCRWSHWGHRRCHWVRRCW